ncbi:hypothetical protein SETIT_4G249800v2 [Setaria italica]|uniref:At1g61320/AtMIF1 LRR domain-containing protein n=1 Tax=Setaria italica TaxID=4555 RepID=A0A368QY33_SETIT|nr:hypothetical protein SETIT_4G249800v2 [Setaria italica]
MRDAARAAGISRQFRQSWKFYRRLIFDIEALGINEDGPVDEVTSDFIRIIDHIMQNHSGIGVKTFRLRAVDCYNVQPSYVDRWLQCAITPGIEDFELLMPWLNKLEYNFPSSLLSTERGSSMKSFALSDCTFHSAAGVGCLSNLREVRLYSVHITGEDLLSCYDIVRLKIPCRPIHISLGHPTQLRHIEMLSLHDSNMLYSASAKLPSIAPNLQTLFLTSNSEIANTPMVHGKFIHLKYLEIALIKPSSSPDYDFYSLDSFLDGSPALDTFTLRSMIELAKHILERAPSLEHITLDTSRGRDDKSGNCAQMLQEELVEARRARLAIGRHLEEHVPSTVSLKVVESCSTCVY